MLEMRCKSPRISKLHFADIRSYHSIRIDTVHYCPREDDMYKGANDDWPSEDKSESRLKQLTKTLRLHNPSLGLKVHLFKLPYMLRQHNIKELAQAVGAMPNLLHVDLPTGFFSGEPRTEILRAELEARCPNLKKMSYHKGAEQSLQRLAMGSVWRNLEVLELEQLVIDPIVIRQALAGLSCMKAFKILGIKNADNTLFLAGPRLPPFPALVELIVEDTPAITGVGILEYLSSPLVQQTLTTLSFSNTGVLPSHLHAILEAAPKLKKLSIIQSVSNHFGLHTSHIETNLSLSSLSAQHNTPLLRSSSLEILHFEILTHEEEARSGSQAAVSYYDYLSSSLLAGGLPNLQMLFVRDINFADSLIINASPALPFAGGNTRTNRLSSNNPFAPANLAKSIDVSRPFNQELQIYTKGVDDVVWGMTEIEDSLPSFVPNGRPQSSLSIDIPKSPRLLSAYGLTNGTDGGLVSPSWTTGFGGNGNVRRSIMIGNGAGQFLEVPESSLAAGNRRSSASMARPGSALSGGGEWPSGVVDEKRSSRYDMWR